MFDCVHKKDKVVNIFLAQLGRVKKEIKYQMTNIELKGFFRDFLPDKLELSMLCFNLCIQYLCLFRFLNYRVCELVYKCFESLYIFEQCVFLCIKTA